MTNGSTTIERAADLERRGALVIADRVVERIAGRAALEVDQVVPTGSRFDRVIGQRYPKVSVAVSGDRARIALDIALSWPAQVAPVSEEVRSTVRSRLGHLTGLHVDAVDVTVSHFIDNASSEPVEPQ